jgi:hypothetical protein
MNQLVIPNCPATTITNVTGTVSGSVTFTATNYTVATTRSFAYTLTFPLSCFSGPTCADLGLSFAQNAQFQSASCSGTTTCVCPIVGQPMNASEAGTYTTSGSTLVTTPNGGGTDSVSYCVEGNRVHFLDIDTIDNMGTITMRTRSDQVAQRQSP